MLKVSKLTDYGSVIMRHLAQQPGIVNSAREIAQTIQLTVPTVSKVLKSLVVAGLVTSERGVDGGYRLARPASEITLVDMITAIEGEPSLTECGTDEVCCSHHLLCSTKSNWQVIHGLIYSTLRSISLQDMTGSLTEHKVVKQLRELFAHE